MVKPIEGKQIFRTVPARDIQRLRSVVPVRSFDFGKDTLEPALRNLFAKEGLTPREINLDLPAKARLLAMAPTLAQRVEAGESAKAIFSSLEISPFTTKDQNLYLLVDKGNIKLLEAAQKKKPGTKPAKRQPPRQEGIPVRIPTIPITSPPLLIGGVTGRSTERPRLAPSIRLTRSGGLARALLTDSVRNQLMGWGVRVNKVYETQLDFYGLEIDVDARRIGKIRFTFSERPDLPNEWGPVPLPSRARETEWLRLTIFNLNLTSAANQKYGGTLGKLTIFYRDKTNRTIEVVYDRFGAVI